MTRPDRKRPQRYEIPHRWSRGRFVVRGVCRFCGEHTDEVRSTRWWPEMPTSCCRCREMLRGTLMFADADAGALAVVDLVGDFVSGKTA